MSEGVIISSKGLYKVRWKNKKWVKTKVKAETVLTALRDTCTLEKGVKLKHILKVVEQYDLLKLFISQYSWCPDIDAFHRVAFSKSKPNDLTKLVINKSAGCIDYFYISGDFHGVGPDEKTKKEITYSVSMTPLNEIADLPIELDTNLEIWSEYKKNNPSKVILKMNSEFTLLELLDAIYWDISFYGGPEETEAFKNCMVKRIEDFKSKS